MCRRNTRRGTSGWFASRTSWRAACLSAAGVILLCWAEQGPVVAASLGAIDQSEPVAVAVTLLDARTDGIKVRSRMSLSVVNISGAALTGVTLRLERPSAAALTAEDIELGDLGVDATGVADRDLVTDDAFVQSAESFMFRVSYISPGGEATEVVVTAPRVMGGGW